MCAQAGMSGILQHWMASGRASTSARVMRVNGAGLCHPTSAVASISTAKP